MKKIVGSLVVVTFLASSAFGGTVSFDPGVVVVDPSVSTVATFDLGLVPDTLAVFDVTDILMGSNDGLAVTGFVFATGAGSLSEVFGTTTGPAVFGLYASDQMAGGNNQGSVDAVPLAFGTLTVDAAGLAPGLYEVMVSPTVEVETWFMNFSLIKDNYGGAGVELMSGLGVVEVIPEPATLALLGLGCVGFLRRRK